MKGRLLTILAFLGLTCGWSLAALQDRPDILFAGFEGPTYGEWTTTGAAFGAGPAKGTLPGQMPVSGFIGKGLVNSFLGGDGSTGTLTSPEFSVERKSITFLIGGGGHADKTCMNLVVAGKVVRTATGPNTEAGGSEALEPAGWDVAEFLGKKARLQIVDDAIGGWGHINVDQIVFTDRPTPTLATPPSRDILVTSRYLLFPVKTGGKKRKLVVQLDGRDVRAFDIELAEGTPDWWAPLDVSSWRGKSLSIRTSRPAPSPKALDAIDQADEPREATAAYGELLRPQLHFSPRRGWTNDPNGLVYANGEYHLFFQHNPYGWNWGNMHWGHAVSKDLVHWQELPIALYPYAYGDWAFSGSAVVDAANTSGLGENGKGPLIAAYTSTGRGECIVFSNDNGRTWKEFAGNPVVKHVGRDPKLLWHEPTKQWVMAVYDEAEKKRWINFYTSPNLKEWTYRSRIEGFFECPDLFELPVDGDATKKKWVLTAASSEYMVGQFDGAKFTPETPKLTGHRGKGFYAAQTFSDIPSADGRVIQIGWMQAPSPGMQFNQAMSIPLELSLQHTPTGPRLAWKPVRELDVLREKPQCFDSVVIGPGGRFEATSAANKPIELSAVIEPGKGTKTTLILRGIPIVYDAGKQELVVHGHTVPAPLENGKLALRILLDRTLLEAFANEGRTFVPMPVIPKSGDAAPAISVEGGETRLKKLEVHEMGSIWSRK